MSTGQAVQRWMVGAAIGIVVGTASTLAFMRAAAAEAATVAVAPVDARLQNHLEEMAKLRPEMKATVTKLEDKIDVLIEDCYRRGGCKR